MRKLSAMPRNPPLDDLIASIEVCDRLKIDRSTLSRWIAAGKLKPAKQLPGARGAFLFRAADVDAFALSRATS